MDRNIFGDPKDVMDEILTMAEGMTHIHLEEARTKATSDEDRKLRISKVVLACGMALSVIGATHYRQRAGSKLFGKMVGDLLEEGMERITDILET